MQLIIDTANTSLTVRNRCFFVENKTTSRQISPSRISSIAISTNCTINAAAIKLAANHQVPILVFNHFGTIQARMESPYFKNLASLRKKQLLFSLSPAATDWIIDLFNKKTEEQIRTLRKLSRAFPSRKEDTEESCQRISKFSSKIKQLSGQIISEVRASLMGLEGAISKEYLSCLSGFLLPDFQFKSRSRRPARDYFNAGLNYLYGMTYSVVEGGIFAKGLDPAIGILHSDQYQEPTLAFDLIEPFRPVMDRMLVDVILEGTLLAEHFIRKKQGYWVNKAGKRLIISSFNDFLGKRVEYGGRVRRLKDHIFQESNELGNYLEEHIEIQYVLDHI